MNPAEWSTLQQVLHGRYEAITDCWYQVVASVGFASLSPTETRQRLVELTKQVTELLLAEQFQHPRARAIGATLAHLCHMQPEALGRTLEMLAHHLVQGLPGDQVAALQPRLSALLGELATGFVQQAHDTILDEQEQIHLAVVSTLQRTEQALKIKDAAMESALTAIALSDLEGKVTYVNRAFLTMWGYDDRQQVLGRDVVDLWQSGDWASAMMQAIEEIGGWVGKLVARRKNDSTFSVLVSASIVEDDAGKPIRMMGSFVDMTHRERANEMLRRHVERLGVLHDIDSAILAVRSAEEIAQAALRHIRRLLPCQGASVVLFDFEAGEFILLAVQSGSESNVGAGARFSMEGAEKQIGTLEQGQACLIDDIQSLSTLPAAMQVPQADGLCSYLAVPLCPQGELIGTLLMWAERVGALGQEHLPIAQEIANTLAIAIQHARLLESVTQQRERLRTLTARLAEAQDAERRQIARVLHDEIGQNLTALGLNLNLVQTQMDQDASQPVLSRLDDSLALVEKTTERVRHVMADLRPPMLDDYGLIPTLRWYGEQFTSRTGVPVIVQGEEPIPRLATQIENALCRITQEALTNVVKHARASQVTITITTADQIARLVVADDGVGFDRAQLAPPDESRGWGLLTMTERAEAIGAQCRIVSHPQQGTQVIVEAVL